MLATCSSSSLKLFEADDSTRDLSSRVPCGWLTAAVLQMKLAQHDGLLEEDKVKDWLDPDLENLLASLNMGEASEVARKQWESKSSFGNILVYGDYDTDGISATTLALEIFRNKAAQIRYFIPRRDIQGYGLNVKTLDNIARSGCNTLVVVDCGTNDSKMLDELASRGVSVFVFDHHTVAEPATFPTIVNPSASGGDKAKKLCATAVLWCWAWKEKIVSRDWLKYSLDLVALATISDCMPLNLLNRAFVSAGMALMRRNPRRGLSALFSRLGIDQSRLSEELLSMRVIPCLNAPGRVSCADLSVRALLGIGNSINVFGAIDELIKANRKRQSISERIADEIKKSGKVDDEQNHVLFDDNWPVGVLSGVASRICTQHRSPIVLAAPTAGKIRGTLRVPPGGNAVGILNEISDKLDAWGGHRYAAGFSVLVERWPEVRGDLEKLLANIQVEQEVVPAIKLSPANISLDDWHDVTALGPFGNDNPCPLFYRPVGFDDRIEPLGHDGKHVAVCVDNSKLLAFNAAADFSNADGLDIKGWVYHPRIDYWRNNEQVQFILDYAVI